MVLFYYLIFALLVNVSVAHICDVCDCDPNANKDFFITCGCESIKHLQFTSSMMMGVESATTVLINNCHIVSIEERSFTQLRKLDTLEIENCLHLYIATGALSNPSSLLINKVQDISFGAMALMSVTGLKNIVINSSNITRLSNFSFYVFEEMDRFSFIGVNIGRVTKFALNIRAKSIRLENMKVDYSEANGVSLQAQKAMIKNSQFDVMEHNSINIRTDFHTRLLENDFRGHFEINITSPFVEFYGNHFENFDPQVFANIKSLRFMNNVIVDSNFEQLLRSFDHKDFHVNKFGCKCGMNLLNSTRHSPNYEILRNNYCIANCSLSLFEFEVESTPTCMMDYRVDPASYCTYEISLKRVTVKPTQSKTVNVTEAMLESRFLISHENENSNGRNLVGKINLFLTIFLWWVYSVVVS